MPNILIIGIYQDVFPIKTRNDMQFVFVLEILCEIVRVCFHTAY